MLMLLGTTLSADKLFHSFAFFCENENCLISSLYCLITNVSTCALVLLSSLNDFFYLNLVVSGVVKSNPFRRIS